LDFRAAGDVIEEKLFSAKAPIHEQLRECLAYLVAPEEPRFHEALRRMKG